MTNESKLHKYCKMLLEGNVSADELNKIQAFINYYDGKMAAMVEALAIVTSNDGKLSVERVDAATAELNKYLEPSDAFMFNWREFCKDVMPLL